METQIERCSYRGGTTQKMKFIKFWTYCWMCLLFKVGKTNTTAKIFIEKLCDRGLIFGVLLPRSAQLWAQLDLSGLWRPPNHSTLPGQIILNCWSGVKDIWWVTVRCLKGVRMCSGQCLEGVWSVSESCLGNYLKVSWNLKRSPVFRTQHFIELK